VAREDEIRLIAYSMWEQQGCTNGKDCEHWLSAEAIWEEHQKPKATAANIKTQPTQVAKKTNRDKAAKNKR
jgi:hypothetical protein